MEKATLAIGLIVLATAVWSLMGVYTHMTVLSPTTLTLIRLAVPTLILTPWVVARHRTPMSLLWHPWSLGIATLNIIRAIFYFIGFQHLPVGQAILLLYTWPVMLAVLGMVVIKEPWRWMRVVWAALCLVGITLIEWSSIRAGMPNAIGVVAILLSAFTNACMLLALRRHPVTLSASGQVWIQNGLGALCLLPFGMMTVSQYEPTQLGLAVGVCFLVGVCGYGLFFKATQWVSPVTGSFLAYLEVVFTFWLGYVMLNQQMTALMMMGGALIVVGAVGSQWGQHREH
ncbi:DMT family transporter [bacterium]|nr:DMT family transporter [bacterium]